MENTRFNTGELDTLVTLQNMTQTIGNEGQRSWTVASSQSVYAKIERDTAEAISDMNYEAQSSLVCTLYKVTGLSTRWRVVVGQQTYEIRSIDDVSRWSHLCVLTLSAIA